MADLPKVFGNKTRVQIMACLADGKRDVTYLVRQCNLSQSAVSQHLQVLTDADVVEKRKQGRNVICALKKHDFGEVAQQILRLDESV